MSWPRGFSPGFLASFVLLNRIRGFRDFNSENLYQQQPVLLSFHVFLQVIRCTTHTVISTVCKYKLWTSHTHDCKARPLTTVGRTSLSVIISSWTICHAGSTFSAISTPSLVHFVQILLQVQVHFSCECMFHAVTPTFILLQHWYIIHLKCLWADRITDHGQALSGADNDRL